MNIEILESASNADATLNISEISQDVGTYDPGCYCIYCKENGRFYIGSSAYMGQRKSNHFSELSKGKHSNSGLQKDYDDFGKDEFVFFVVENCEVLALQETERRIVERLKNPLMYNSKNGVVRSKKTYLENTHMPKAEPMSDKINIPQHSDDAPEGSLIWLAGKIGVKYDTLYRKARRKFPDIEWSTITELTQHQVDVLSDKSRKQNGLIKRVSITKETSGLLTKNPEIQRKLQNVNQPEPAENKRPPARQKSGFKWPTRQTILRAAVSVILIAIVICHAALIWYDCAILWDMAGKIGGGAVFLVVLAAVLLAADTGKVYTAESALAFVFFVDVAAWWVHYPVFRTPLVSDTITGVLCGFLCATSFAALYLFKSKNNEQ